jgi:hypothetical protein
MGLGLHGRSSGQPFSGTRTVQLRTSSGARVHREEAGLHLLRNDDLGRVAAIPSVRSTDGPVAQGAVLVDPPAPPGTTKRSDPSPRSLVRGRSSDSADRWGWQPVRMLAIGSTARLTFVRQQDCRGSQLGVLRFIQLAGPATRPANSEAVDTAGGHSDILLTAVVGRPPSSGGGR